MKLSLATALALLINLPSLVEAGLLGIQPVFQATATTTQEPAEKTYLITEPTPELEDVFPQENRFVKREPRKKAIVGKEYAKEQEQLTADATTTDIPKPWLRTIYGSIHEIVTPTVIGGVTFSTKPPITTDGLEPWITLNQDGSPKTIKPKLKNGHIKDGKPDPKTYFQTAITVTYDQEQLKAHNLKSGDVHEEVVYVDEDDTYSNLSPLMRCMPDLYFNTGQANHEKSAPFCSPRDGKILKLSKTYFLTWYSRYFEGSEKVKVHFAYVKETSRDKGMKKRDAIPDAAEPPRGAVKELGKELDEMTHVSTFQGDVLGAFYSSDWVSNQQGYFPIEVQEEWLQGKQYKQVAITIQPDNISDEEFDILTAPHIVLKFQTMSTVAKHTKEYKKMQDQTGTDDDIYYVIMAFPTVIMFVVLCVYGFLYMNRNARDLSHIKKPKRSRYGNQGRYNLPVSISDIHKPEGYKKG